MEHILFTYSPSHSSPTCYLTPRLYFVIFPTNKFFHLALSLKGDEKKNRIEPLIKPRQRKVLVFRVIFTQETTLKTTLENTPKTTLKTMKKENESPKKTTRSTLKYLSKNIIMRCLKMEGVLREKNFANISCYCLPPKKNTPKKTGNNYSKDKEVVSSGSGLMRDSNSVL